MSTFFWICLIISFIVGIINGILEESFFLFTFIVILGFFIGLLVPIFIIITNPPTEDINVETYSIVAYSDGSYLRDSAYVLQKVDYNTAKEIKINNYNLFFINNSGSPKIEIHETRFSSWFIRFLCGKSNVYYNVYLPFSESS